MKKDILVFIETRFNEIQNVSFELLGEARRLASSVEGAKVVGALICEDSKKLIKPLKSSGADIIYVVEDKVLKHYLTETYAVALERIIKEVDPNVVLVGATSIGRDLAPRISARINTGLTADCTKLELNEKGELFSTRPAFGGNLFATIICPNHRPQMSTVRPGVMKRTTVVPETVEVINLDVEFKTPSVEVVEHQRVETSVDKIEDASTLVAVGRGCSDASLEASKELAALLKGTTATSRALVDVNKMPHDKQVGQTGKTVRPNAYIACGISGAIQHIAGMEDSEHIIAINKDKYAAIFSVADLGIVGDVNKIIPALIEELKSYKK